MTAIKIASENALSQTGEELYAALINLIVITQDALDDMRRIIADLRPSMLDDLGLLPTLTWFCRRFQHLCPGMNIENHIDIDEESAVPESLKIVIFRLMQEAFNNISKYSQANLVTLSLVKEGPMLGLTIEDNGVGFDVEAAICGKGDKGGFGLISMRERAELTGGIFSIESTPGEGTTINVVWPLEIIIDD